MIGQRFAKLTVIGEAPSVRQANGKNKRAVLARCDCGVEKAFIISNLKSGNSKSCGCEKYSGMAAHNRARATPQEWDVDGDIARLVIGDVTILIDAADLPLVSVYRWGLRGGYAVARGGRLVMHRLILGLEKGDTREGDHRHQITTDNRRSELRIATSSNNKMNRRGNKRGTSRFKGVHFDKAKGRWAAQIKASDRHRLLGRFDTEIAAARAYDSAARQYFGDFAYLNFIAGGA